MTTLQDEYSTYMDHCKAKGIAKATVTYYTDCLDNFVEFATEQGVKTAPELKDRVLLDFQLSMREAGLAKNTVRNRTICIRTFWKWLHETERTDFLTRVKNPKSDNRTLPALSKDELKDVLNFVGRPVMGRGLFYTRRNHAMLVFMVESGLRSIEIRDLRWGDLPDLDDDERSVYQVRVRNGKGNKSRVSAIGKTARNALTQLRDFHKEDPRSRTRKNAPTTGPDDYVFSRQDGKPFTRNGFSLNMRRLSNEVGIEFTAHQLRRTTGALMRENKVPLYDIQRQLGHSSSLVTERYLGKIVDGDVSWFSDSSPLEFLNGGAK